MAERTFDDIVTEGMLKAGVDHLADRVRGYFNDWLQRQAKSWPWPSLTTEDSVTVPAGSLSFGTGGTGSGWSRILDNCWLYRTDRSARQRLRIQQIATPPVGTLNDGNGSQNLGIPTSARIFKDTDFKYTFAFDKRTDREYLLSLSVVVIPARIESPWTQVPWYPEDDTCIQAVMCECLKYENGPGDADYQAALGELAEMVKVDRMRHGVSNSSNSLLQLDQGVFR